MTFGGELRKLSDLGLDRFSDWLLQGAPGAIPDNLLADSTTSAPIDTTIKIAPRTFTNRFEFGQYLNQLLAPLDAGTISRDRGLWSALALCWFDQICPVDGSRRDVGAEHRYILSGDYRHYYRHLVRSPWQLVRDHGENAKFLLLPSADKKPHPLQTSGEVLEALASRQEVLRSRRIIAEARRLYSDPITGRPLVGVAGSGKGSARRLALVLRQFALTFDCENMQSGSVLRLLPSEFDRWKKRIAPRYLVTQAHDGESPANLILGG